MKILGLSGRKQSGKNTICNYIFGSTLVDLGILVHRDIDAEGRLIGKALIHDEVTNENKYQTNYVDPMSRDQQMQELFSKYVWPFVKVYSFADPLKEFCIKVMGLTEEQCYGTNEDKNSPTRYTWGDFSFCLDPLRIDGFHDEHMTARDILQVFGTDVMRKIYNNIWVQATINRILRNQSDISIVCDVRFPNEVKGIQDAGGKVIRLLRAPFANEDQHASETALDDYGEFDVTIDNRELTISQTNQKIVETLLSWGWEE